MEGREREKGGQTTAERNISGGRGGREKERVCLLALQKRMIPNKV